MEKKTKVENVEMVMDKPASSNPARLIDSITGIYIVKPIKKTYLNDLDKNHNGAIMFDRAVYSYAVERDSKTGLVITGLTELEAREFEQSMGLKTGSLSPYNMKIVDRDSGEFSWVNFFIKIPKEGLVINASRSDKDKLYLKLLQAGSRVAKSTFDLANGVNSVYYELILTSVEEEAKVTKRIQNIKKTAYAEASKMSINDWIDFLASFEEGRHKVSKDHSPDVIEARLFEIVDKQPDKFLETINDPHYKTKIFLFKCISAQLIYKQGSKFILANGGDIIGNSLQEAIINLQSDDYNSVKVSLLAKLESR